MYHSPSRGGGDYTKKPKHVGKGARSGIGIRLWIELYRKEEKKSLYKKLEEDAGFLYTMDRHMDQ